MSAATTVPVRNWNKQIRCFVCCCLPVIYTPKVHFCRQMIYKYLNRQWRRWGRKRGRGGGGVQGIALCTFEELKQTNQMLCLLLFASNIHSQGTFLQTHDLQVPQQTMEKVGEEEGGRGRGVQGIALCTFEELKQTNQMLCLLLFASNIHSQGTFLQTHDLQVPQQTMEKVGEEEGGRGRGVQGIALCTFEELKQTNQMLCLLLFASNIHSQGTFLQTNDLQVPQQTMEKVGEEEGGRGRGGVQGIALCTFQELKQTNQMLCCCLPVIYTPKVHFCRHMIYKYLNRQWRRWGRKRGGGGGGCKE